MLPMNTDLPLTVTLNGDGSLTVQQPLGQTVGTLNITGFTSGRYNLSWQQGSEIVQVVNYLDASGNAVNLSGFTADLLVSKVSGLEPGPTVLEASTANGLIAIGTGLTLTLQPSNIAGLAPGFYSYTWIVSGNGIVTRLLQGLITLKE